MMAPLPRFAMAPLLLLLAAAMVVTSALPQHTTAPAMIWCESRCFGSAQRRVDYQIVSAEALPGTAHNEFSLIRTQCSDSHSVDLFVEFIGNELRSTDLSRDDSNSETVNVLKNLIAASNHSLVLPYVASFHDGSSMVNRLLDALHEADFESAVYGCPGAAPNTLQYVEDFAKLQKLRKLVVCLSPGGESSEGKVLQDIVTVIKDAGVNYAALYVSDPDAFGTLRAPHRLLASVNSSSNSTNATEPYCNEVCQTKATLLEAIFVSVVLLVILISGLCCMMGIQTPMRFEKPHDS